MENGENKWKNNNNLETAVTLSLYEWFCCCLLIANSLQLGYYRYLIEEVLILVIKMIFYHIIA